MSNDSGSYIIKAKNPIGECSSTSTVLILTPPKFVKPLTLASSSLPVSVSEMENDGESATPVSKLVANEKSQVKLECQISGTPKPAVKWMLGEEEIKTSDKLKLETKQDLYALLIKECTAKEQGFIKVIAENQVGKAVSKVLLDINNIPIIVKGLAATNEFVLEETELKVELPVTFKSKPKADVTWLYADRQLQDGDDEGHYSIKESTSTDENGDETFTTTLIINNAKLADAGSLKCKLKNPAGEVTSAGALAILRAPVITTPLPESVDLVEKKDIKLECQIADAVPKATITWHKDGTTLNASKRIVIGKPVLDQTTGSYIYSLTISDSTLNDGGVYSVKAANKVLTAESKCVIGVLSPPRIIKDLKPTLEVTEGDKVLLEVTAAGKPMPEFKWYRFDANTNSEVEIVASEEIAMQSVTENGVYNISISRITKEMQGKYILRLTNSAGTVETACNIVVNGSTIFLFDRKIFMFLYLISCPSYNQRSRGHQRQ